MSAHPWDRHVFSLIMPDAITRHMHTGIVERLYLAGFAVRYATRIRVAPEQLDEVNAANIKHHWDSYHYRLLDRLFLSGPVIALVYEDISGSTEDAHVRFKRLKGATDPRAAAPGTIRRDLGGINAMLALMHAADTPARSLFEARLFLGDAVVADEQPLRGSASAGTDWPQVRSLLALLAAEPAERRTFDDVLHGHRAAVLAAAWDDLSPAGRALAGTATRGPDLADDAIGPALAGTLRYGAAHPAYDLLRAGWQPGRLSLSERELRRRAAALEVRLDPWTEMVLLTSAAFAPVRDGRQPDDAPAGLEPASRHDGMEPADAR
jgi:nucleoside diphosphate kinase